MFSCLLYEAYKTIRLHNLLSANKVFGVLTVRGGQIYQLLLLEALFGHWGGPVVAFKEVATSGVE